MTKPLTIFLAGLLSCSSASGSEPKIQTGTYSDMKYVDGGVWGLEITIVDSESGYFALVQCSDHKPGVPELVPLKVHATRISFDLTGSESGCGFPSFEGVIRNGELMGLFYRSSKIFYLRHKPSYWQQNEPIQPPS